MSRSWLSGLAAAAIWLSLLRSGGGVVRHMMITGGAGLVMACSGVNRIALVEVKGDGASR